ncbi:hypothetical protein [Paractinoplanes brasiliensis]|nr:hypothetical protein [Actinoplanes brasiliensis]
MAHGKFQERSPGRFVVGICAIVFIAIFSGYISLSMYREARPPAPISGFDGSVEIDAGGYPDGATTKSIERSYIEVDISMYDDAPFPISRQTAIAPEELMSRKVRISLTLGYIPPGSEVSMHLRGDAQLVPESIEYGKGFQGTRTITEDGSTWQEFGPVVDPPTDGETSYSIIGTLAASPIVRSGADYDVRLPSCSAPYPGWVIGGGKQIPSLSCSIIFGELNGQFDLLNVAPEVENLPTLSWSGRLFGKDPAPQFRIRDRLAADRLDLFFYLSSGLLGITGAAILEALIRIVLYLTQNRGMRPKP